MHCLDLIRGCSGFLFQLFSIISVSQLELGILQRAELCPQGRAHKSQGEKSSAGGSRVQPASLRRTESLTGFHSSRIKKKIKSGDGNVLRMGEWQHTAGAPQATSRCQRFVK